MCQNRNSIIAFAMAEFLTRIHQITMKYSLSEFYSPVSFLRVLLRVNRNNPYRVIQMRESDLYYFNSCSKLFKYKQVPFSEVCQPVFNPCPYTLHYKTFHAQASEVAVDLRGPSTTRRNLAPTCTLPKPRMLPKQSHVQRPR